MKIPEKQSAKLGIDVAKKTFEAAIKYEGRYQQQSFANNKSGYRKLQKWLLKYGLLNQFDVCMEATGIHHLTLAINLHGYVKTVSVVNPRCTKAFADSQLRRSKSDTVDAKIIADFAEAMKPRAWEAPSEEELEIKELARRQKSLTGIISAEKNRLHDARSKSVQKSIRRNIKQMEKEKERILAELSKKAYAEPLLRNRLELLVSIPGVGAATALQLVAELGNVEVYENARDLAAFAGLTPRQRQSGTSLSSRGGICKVGSSRLRAMLYFPAMVAIRHNPIMIEFANRLRQSGKTGKTIIVAVMRKLLHCIFGVLKNNQPFNPQITCPI